MKTELHCHECQRYFEVEFDHTINGNHVVNCPNCNHEHCRVIKDGVVTSDRWDQRNGPTIQSVWSSTSTTATATHVYGANNSTAGTCATDGTCSASLFMQDAWVQTTVRYT